MTEHEEVKETKIQVHNNKARETKVHCKNITLDDLRVCELERRKSMPQDCSGHPNHASSASLKRDTCKTVGHSGRVKVHIMQLANNNQQSPQKAHNAVHNVAAIS